MKKVARKKRGKGHDKTTTGKRENGKKTKKEGGNGKVKENE
jgi:hypothetical protein